MTVMMNSNNAVDHEVFFKDLTHENIETLEYLDRAIYRIANTFKVNMEGKTYSKAEIIESVKDIKTDLTENNLLEVVNGRMAQVNYQLNPLDEEIKVRLTEVEDGTVIWNKACLPYVFKSMASRFNNEARKYISSLSSEAEVVKVQTDEETAEEPVKVKKPGAKASETMKSLYDYFYCQKKGKPRLLLNRDTARVKYPEMEKDFLNYGKSWNKLTSTQRKGIAVWFDLDSETFVLLDNEGVPVSDSYKGKEIKFDTPPIKAKKVQKSRVISAEEKAEAAKFLDSIFFHRSGKRTSLNKAGYIKTFLESAKGMDFNVLLSAAKEDDRFVVKDGIIHCEANRKKVSMKEEEANPEVIDFVEDTSKSLDFRSMDQHQLILEIAALKKKRAELDDILTAATLEAKSRVRALEAILDEETKTAVIVSDEEEEVVHG